METPVDTAFVNISRRKSAFLIWRVESMKLKPVAERDHGKFHRGDSYIIYCATGEYDSDHISRGSHDQNKQNHSNRQVHIHFWLGSQTSNDEAGVAAIKTVELDNFLGGTPVQHREVEEQESARFKSYFRQGIRYLEGGVNSGLRQVDNVLAPRMFMVKGKRQAIIRQTESIDWKHMNDGDVFVIDTDSNIFVWTGTSSNNMEKIQGARLALSLKEEHGGGCIVIVESGKELSMTVQEREALNKVLPLRERTVRTAIPDEKVEKSVIEDLILYRCSDESGQLIVDQIKRGHLTQTDLNSDDSFIVDNGKEGVWLWVGKKASKKERSEGMKNAQTFVAQWHHSRSLKVTRVIDGGEPKEFKSLFCQWQDKYQTQGLGTTQPLNRIAINNQEKYDANTMHKAISAPAPADLSYNGEGTKKVWRVHKFELVEVDNSEHGKFFSGDCYVIMNTYQVNGRKKMLIYFWLGSQSSADERGTAALKARDLDDEHGGVPVQVRVVQGKEPGHFMAMFNGRIIIYSGGRASSFDGADAKDQLLADSYMLQVRQTCDNCVRAVQVDAKARSLNSNDCFVIKMPKAVYVWYGKGSTDAELNASNEIAKDLDSSFSHVTEGEETTEFWSLLGGQTEYSSEKRLTERRVQPARLFQCSNAGGTFSVEEIADFDQSDLIEDDVMLLDAWDTLYLWLGSGCNAEERRESERVAIEYLASDPAGRGTDLPILKVKQGHEPLSFTGYFGVWSDSHWTDQPSWQHFRQQIAAQHTDTPSVQRVHPEAVARQLVFTADRLRSGVDLPDAVDLCHKEHYLSDEEFVALFQMNRQQFASLSQWKQTQHKKRVGLF